MVDPDCFLGGRKKPDAKKAYAAIKKKIADTLGISVESAGHLIKRIVDEHMGITIYKEIALTGLDPREFIMFACGGGGPTHACGFAEAAKIPLVATFP